MKRTILRTSYIMLLNVILIGVTSCSKDSVQPSSTSLLLIKENGSNNISMASVNLETGSISKKGIVGDLLSWPDKNLILNDAVYITGTPSDTKLQRVYKYRLNDDKVSYFDVNKTMAMAGNYNGNIVSLWWDGKEEKFGLFDTNNGSVKELGTVGDLYWWYVQCFIKDNFVYAFGMMEDQKDNYLYKCDINNGKFVEKIKVSANYTFAGFFNNGCIVLSWDGKQVSIGSLNLDNGTVTKFGEVTGIKSWGMQTTITGDTLYLLAENNSSTTLNIYGFNLKEKKLTSTVKSTMTSAIFVKK